MAENEIAKYLSIYRKRKKEDDALGGLQQWPDYQGAAQGYSGGSGGGVGGVGNAGGIVAPGGSSNMLAAFASGAQQRQLDQGSGGGGQPEGPQPGREGTLEDAITGIVSTLPFGVTSLLGFVGLSEKEKAQQDINLGLNTTRAQFGRALGMTPTVDPYSYSPSDASGFTDQPGPSGGPTSAEVNAGTEPAQSTPTSAAQNFGETAPYGVASNPQGGESAAGGGYSGGYGGGYGDREGAGGGPGAPGSGPDLGQAGNVGGASSESPGLYAYGGMVTPDALAGPDLPGPDEGVIGARPNEFVMQPQAVQYYGPEIMDALNEGEIPREALMQMLQGSEAEFTPRNNLAEMAPRGRNNLAMMAR